MSGSLAQHDIYIYIGLIARVSGACKLNLLCEIHFFFRVTDTCFSDGVFCDVKGRQCSKAKSDVVEYVHHVCSISGIHIYTLYTPYVRPF